MCGGMMDLPPGEMSGVCSYCGCLTTYPKVADQHREQLYNRAEHFRRLNDFDKAVSAYEKLLNEDDSDPEAYWGLVLSRYGIEYVEDPATHERIPTCHRVQFESILADPDYKMSLEKSSGVERDIYEKEAQRIAEIQKGILAISAREKPFDVFICYKETTDGGTRTKDSVDAQEIYYRLTNAGYKVFFSRITLEKKLGQQYEPYIFAALNSAKVMLVIGTKKEYFDAVWVRNEWSRFLALMKKDRSKLLIPCYKEMDVYDIPEELSMLQSQDMSKLGYMQDLFEAVKKVVRKEEETKKTSAPASNPATPLVKRIGIFLFQKDWASASQYCNRVLDMDPENPQVFIYKLMAEKQLTTEDDLLKINGLEQNADFQLAVRFSDAAGKQKLNGILQKQAELREKAERERQEEIRRQAELREKAERERQEAVRKAFCAELRQLAENFAIDRDHLDVMYYILSQCTANASKIPELLEVKDQLAQRIYACAASLTTDKMLVLEYLALIPEMPQAAELQKEIYSEMRQMLLTELEKADDPTKRAHFFVSHTVKSYRKAAERGDAQGQYDLGKCYEAGFGMAKDPFEAVKWYRKAAENGHAEAMMELGKHYLLGRLFPADHALALEWLKKAASKLERQKAYEKAVGCYFMAAFLGNAWGQFNLGYCFYHGEGLSQDYNDAVTWYRLAAYQGNAGAQCNFGLCYECGQGVPKDYNEAAKWYRLSADKGDAVGQCNLGCCYDNGEGVPKNQQEAAEWYRKSAEQGYARAQNLLGYDYEYGEGVPKDYNEAAKWYRKAAEQGYAAAQYNLGKCYYNNIGVPKDYNEAVKWYRKAADQGYVNAQNMVGICYDNGYGVPQDYHEAQNWFRKAAEKGHARAQNSLGCCYYNGQGVPKDYQEALKWFRLAAEQGNADAQKNIRELFPGGKLPEKEKPQPQFSWSSSGYKKRWVFILLGIFMGPSGFHNFYAGDIMKGLTKLGIIGGAWYLFGFPNGLVGPLWIWSFIEVLITKEDADGNPFD